MQRTYISIDLKSFYASVECRERGFDPLDTNLVVADERRTDKTICLAVTPSLKSYGIPGRGRLFEVKQRVQQINAARRFAAPGRQLCGSSCSYAQLQSEPQLALDFIIAPPRMAYYMEYSTQIYEIYLRYVAPEDIIVYSVDEVFMDVTQYFELYGLSARELAMRIIWMFCAKQVLPLLQASALICFWRRWRWMCGRSILRRMPTACGLRSWTSRATGVSCGSIGR